MTFSFILLLLLCIFVFNAKAQKVGTDIVSYGYDIFGQYANVNSRSKYKIFKEKEIQDLIDVQNNPQKDLTVNRPSPRRGEW